jgi:hypothetical protein
MAIVLMISLFVLCIKAQTYQLKRTVIGIGGMVGISNSNGTKISYQTGQYAIGTVTNSSPGSNSYYLNQGFWIPSSVISTEIEEQPVSLNNDLFNYPNPVSQNTTIEFKLSTASNITLRVYNMIGKEVKIIFDGFKLSGVQKITWDTKGDNGLALPAGTYLYELQVRSTDMKGADSFSNFAFRNILVIVR